MSDPRPNPTNLRKYAKGDFSIRGGLMRRAADEIERLREKKEQQHAEIGLLLKRIEELEEAYKVATSTEHLPPGCGKHIITTEQIRAAWLAARGSESSLSILRLLGIVRCEGCGGDGHSMSTFAAKHEQVRTGTCPDCNGEGFKIGGSDGF